MPANDVGQVDETQLVRVKELALNSDKLRYSMLNIDPLFNEANSDFAKSMNKIIFDKYLNESPDEILSGSNLILPEDPDETDEVPFNGLIQLDKNDETRDFSSNFKEFCLSSLFTKNEVLHAMDQITIEASYCQNLQVFQQTFSEAVRLEEFRSQQEANIQGALNHLKNTWVQNLITIIRSEFGRIEKGWFNINEANRNSYEQGKLKRFLALTRQMMQDNLLILTRKSYNSFYDFLKELSPLGVRVVSPKEVHNTFPEDFSSLKIRPLFLVDLLKSDDSENFEYSTKPLYFVQAIMNIFERTLIDLARIPDPEAKVVPNFYEIVDSRSRAEYIKASKLPEHDPEGGRDETKSKHRHIINENKWLYDLHKAYRTLMETAIAPLFDYANIFEKYKVVAQINPEDYVKKLDAEEPPKGEDEIKDEVYKYQKAENELREAIPQEIQVSLFQVNNREIISLLAGRYTELQRLLINLIAKRSREKTQKLRETFQALQKEIKAIPKNIEELTKLSQFIDGLPRELEKIQTDIDNCMSVYSILDEFNFRLSEEEDKRKWSVFSGPRDLNIVVDDVKRNLANSKLGMQQRMIAEQAEFKEEIQHLDRQIMSFHQYRDLNKHEEVAKIAAAVNDSLKSAQEKARIFNSHESLFGVESTDYAKISQISKDFLPYSNLWITADEWIRNSQIWTSCEWESLNAEDAEKFVEEAVRTLGSTVRFFKDKDIQHIQKIAETVKEQLDVFRPKVPLMVAMRKQGMQERHWQQISEVCGFPVAPGEGFTFQKVLDMGLMKYVDKIVEVGEKASKEFAIEDMLKKMKIAWEPVKFQTLAFKNTLILKGYDEIGALIDEHIVNTQAMSFSPFKKPFEADIMEWNSTLLLMSNIVEEWAKCQGQYMYLSPIFESPDIAKQLPKDSKRFKAVDATWKACINYCKEKDYEVVATCQMENLLQKLQESNVALEEIQKSLNDYLEKKREAFARFYFLSNDELLEILSETKDPTKVQPHLRKVFENIYTIEFDSNKNIQAMFSGEGEKVDFFREVTTNKNVEFWMGDVENMMKISVRQVLLNSITEYKKHPRVEWVVSHPGQCVLNGSQVHWTAEVEEAIKTTKVPDYLEKLNGQISDLVKLIRTNLTPMKSITVNALIVIDVHARDVVAKLKEANITDIAAFEWISQLRYYWENDDCYVKCIQTSFPYGYEYLGNTLRLVITPLTDKCYMTLMGALKLNLGGAPAGPAGTGKTESTKDLAKALAKQCVVFNCSEGMDYNFVGKFFKGLASAGAWACFDEFNRINIEVLSVIAQQLLLLFGAKASGAKELMFEGSNIRLNPTFCVFITMNPGYAGRTELPDNLKALFRGVAMMVPDYALIGAIMLYSFGFDTAPDLARKMVATFKLASEQLSSQDHYDYGMRAVRSVINAAGLLKRAHPNMNEDQLLLRALRDVNVPKFLKDDLPLFENIISDLFPKIERPKYEYGELLDCINQQCGNMNLQTVRPFIDKVLQLYDTIQVRHGLMLVGPTGGGKTSNYKVLQAAMSQMAKERKGKFTKVHTHILNPKSITMGQLYGESNAQTKEWTDGILASIVRDTVRDLSGELHWVMFDGPVDALWIESMNTVLDDNKKLCLNSGQILILTAYMTMMFEVEDLAVASPATVSRCGMVYMEPVAFGMKPLIDSWISQLPTGMKNKKTFIPALKGLIDTYLETSIEWLKKECKETVYAPINSVAQSFMKLIDCEIEKYRDSEYKKVQPEEIDNFESMLESIFFFSLIWSVGCTTDLDGRVKFDAYLRQAMLDNKATLELPTTGSIYDFYFNQKTKTFDSWTDLNKNFEINDRLSFSEIVVPTKDYTRMLQLMKTLLTNSRHVMVPGPTGTGKSLNAYTLLQTGLPQEYQYISITFSAQTSANQTQDTIDSKLEKRRKGIFGPPTGKKCVIFVDDLNMPKKEEYGAQPPLEILRQYLDHKGWYERKNRTFQRLEDLILLTAMGPPGGGRTHITNRLVRHFNMLTYTDLEEQTTKDIFNTILDFFLRRFSDSARSVREELVNAVLRVYNKVKEELRPLPNKSFYTFNLRDISKVMQGVCSASIKHTPEKIQLVRLWYHENLRVFHDRLTTEEDREFLKDLLKSEFPKFELTVEDVINRPRIIFGDFMQGREAEPKFYIQIDDLNNLLKKMDDYLEEYNTDVASGKRQMKLVMFLDACEHIARIARVLRQPSGHALLLGVGGSGRQSLARMASFISRFKLIQVEVVKGYNMAKWREDLKKCLMRAGVNNEQVTFLFVDTQIIKEDMLEDINNILNSGDVTNLYKVEDMEEIMKECRGECVKKGMEPNKMNIFSQYLARIKRNIHCVIAMSPLGEVFRTRLRMFPSLVNCCTIDWFTEWPEEALIGVGKGAIIEVAADLNIEHSMSNCVEMFKRIHKSVEKISIKFLAELRRHNYVTPSSYLEQLNLFKLILTEKQADLKKQIERLKNGLDKLKEANENVAQLQINLTDLKPKLAQAEIETNEMLERLVVDKKEADDAQKIVAEDEAVASKQQAEAAALQKEALESVAEAQKILSKAVEEVKKLKKSHLEEIRSFSSPPRPVYWTLAGVCVILGEKVPLKPVPGSMTGEKKEDFFEYSKDALLSDPQGLLNRLTAFAEGDQKNNINPKFISQFEQKVKVEPDFQEDRVNNANLATRMLWAWVNAMYTYHGIYLSTKPLRDKLAACQAILDEKTAQLKLKKDELDKINNTLRVLQEKYDFSINEKERLKNELKMCEIKLERAHKLVSGLADEKERWGLTIQELKNRGDLLAGDSIVAAGMLAYSGPFVAQFRSELESEWVKNLDEIGIKHTPGIRMKNFLGDGVKIQAWNIAGLPKDDTSTENGIIIDKGRRWPLMIDPQTQANKYIRNLGKEHAEGIDVYKASDANQISKTIDLAIQFGKMFLIENVGNDLDPSLDPVITKQIYKQGGSWTITIGDKNIPYNDHFKLFLTTTNPNPHYPPETFVKVTIINFAITPSGLEEQMLAQIVALENPQLEQKKTDIVKKNAAAIKELVHLEDDILKSLSESQGDILMDETLINKLANSKKMSKEINIKVEESKITEKEIDIAREGYRPVAFRASILFFCINDLSSIDPMYQYSLQWFINLFSMGVENAPASNDLAQRLNNLNNYFTYSLYENICRSLFEKHKLLFSLLLAVRIQQGSAKLDEEEWRYFLTGYMRELENIPNPTKWIPDNSWPGVYRQFYGMDQLPKLKGILKHFIDKPDEFKNIYDAVEAQEQPLPEPWNAQLDELEKMIVLKAIRSDKLVPAIQEWVKLKIGKEFVEPPTFNLSQCFKDATVTTPLIFVLSPGSDPVADFLRFAEEMGFSKKYEQISLGQGQGPKADKLIKQFSNTGGWVLLQNCHLAASWMGDLERNCEEINDTVHKDFRLWLTSMPTPSFPISVLQNGIKMTLEPPTGLKSNLLRTYNTIDDKDLQECKKPEVYKKLLFGFALFHAIVQDRRKFGPIGWNIPYEFTNEDFTVCKRQLKIFVNEYEAVPYKVLNYLGAEINYGGRVTDDKDVRLIKTILMTYITPEALGDGFKFSNSGIYFSPAAGDQADYINYIKTLPLNPSPEAFGLHENAEITTAENTSRVLLETILSIQPRAANKGGKSAEEVIMEIATNVQKRTPPVYDFEAIFKKYPTEYKESMNTVLVQEIIRYNRLLSIMASSLSQVKKALKGEIVMSEDLEGMARNLNENQVPKLWAGKSFLSLKPLASWIEDLNKRIKFLSDWVDFGTPNHFWISGFFFPQAFITGTLQNYARKHEIAIDELTFTFSVLDTKTYHDVTAKPEDGCYIWGMYLEGARWDYDKHILNHSKPKELYTDIPLMWLIPKKEKPGVKPGMYECPCYKVLSRAGTLSTTGHSTNFVMFIELPSEEEQHVWIKAGVAAFLALRY